MIDLFILKMCACFYDLRMHVYIKQIASRTYSEKAMLEPRTNSIIESANENDEI